MAVDERIQQSLERAAESSGTPDIRLDRITKSFGDIIAVDDLSLEIPRGSFFALLGPSGCGKTTTLRMIGGFEEPTAGLIYTPSSLTSRFSRTSPSACGERARVEET